MIRITVGGERREIEENTTVETLLAIEHVEMPEYVSVSVNEEFGEIVVPAFGLSIKLHEGENKVFFTPENADTVAYSCWMGMIKSSINVVD